MFFAGVYFACLVASLIFNFALIKLANIDLPSIMGLIIFYLSAHWGGSRYGARSSWRWDRSERHVLAVRYSATALAISLLLAAPVVAFSPELRAMPMSAWLLAALVTPLYAWAQYGVARWVFAKIDERAPFPGETK